MSRLPHRRGLVRWLVSAGLVLACGSGPASPAPQVLVNGRVAPITCLPVTGGGDLLVWVRDLERMGLGEAQWDGATRSAVLVYGRTRIRFQAGSPQAVVTTTSPGGRPTERRRLVSHAATLSAGRLMAPLSSVCEELGIAHEWRGGSAVNLWLTDRVPTEGRLASRVQGAITGVVRYGGRALPGVTLRLVRDADSAFVPDRRARTDAQGRYWFPNLPPGRYRVYAYVGDNPDYFNRETAAFTVTNTEIVAPTIAMGRVVRPVQPQPGASVPYGERLAFEWTPCRGAARYEFSIADPETGEEVVLKNCRPPRVEVLGDVLTLGRRYHWRVLALAANGDFIGATPGAGAEPWSFVVVAGDTADALTGSR